jgi:ABC-type multidrug transport system fused ATPase/permease subunit
MYIIAIAWIYVVFMMSITETTVIAGIMTFLLYGVLPVSIIVYVMGTGGRKRKRRAQEMQRQEELKQDRLKQELPQIESTDAELVERKREI